MRGTTAAWNNLPIADRNSDTLYFIADAASDEGLLYLGNKLIAGGSSDKPLMKLDDLDDVVIDSNLGDLSYIVFDWTSQTWVNKDPRQLVFGGASASAMGKAGLVPVPQKGQDNLFLRGDGTWAAANCSASLYEVTLNDGETHDAAIARITSGSLVLNGDITVVKTAIVENNYQHTAYVFSQAMSKWVALDGNYDASNVYFNDDFVFTEAVGTVTIGDTGSETVSAKGKNVQEFLAGLFAAARDPQVTDPTLTMAYNGTSTSYEVGTTVTPAYKATFKKGEYEFGPDDTGVTATYAISDTNGKTATTASGSMPEFVVADNTNYYISASVTHTDGVAPLNNVGTPIPGAAIRGTTLTKNTATMTGYRASFIGKDSGTGALTSDLIRGLICQTNEQTPKNVNGFNYNGKKEYLVTADANTTRFIIAVPADNTRAGLTSAAITTSLNAPAKDNYVYTENAVDVEGKDGYTAVKYDVWVYQPASLDEGQTHLITLG
jgi:hypothetical protein